MLGEGVSKVVRPSDKHFLIKYAAALNLNMKPS